MSRFYVQAEWDDVPHLSEAAKKELLESIPAFQREARVKGIPQLGAGAVYPVQVADITVPDFTIPKDYRRVFGLDVGWNWTAAIFGALNEQTDTLFLYDCYKRGQAEPVVHVEAIKARGPWIPGVCDPAAVGSNQKDGQKMFTIYRELGLNIERADNAVTSGVLQVWNRLSSGRLKVFASLSQWFAEFSLYHRDEHGRIVKQHDHLMDATRYLVLSGLKRAIVQPAPAKPVEEQLEYLVGPGGSPVTTGWMGA